MTFMRAAIMWNILLVWSDIGSSAPCTLPKRYRWSMSPHAMDPSTTPHYVMIFSSLWRRILFAVARQVCLERYILAEICLSHPLKNQCDMLSQRVCWIHFYLLLHLKQFLVQLSMKGSFSHRNTRQQGHRVISASRVIILSMTVRFRSHIISKSELNNTAKSFTKNKRSMSSTIERDRNYCIF
jgi:hypothetical protein